MTVWMLNVAVLLAEPALTHFACSSVTLRHFQDPAVDKVTRHKLPQKTTQSAFCLLSVCVSLYLHWIINHHFFFFTLWVLWPLAKCSRASVSESRRSVFVLLYMSELSDTVKTIKITPALWKRLINARLNGDGITTSPLVAQASGARRQGEDTLSKLYSADH